MILCIRVCICVQDFGLDVAAFQPMAGECPPPFLGLAVTCCCVSLSFFLRHVYTPFPNQYSPAETLLQMGDGLIKCPPQATRTASIHLEINSTGLWNATGAMMSTILSKDIPLVP